VSAVCIHATVVVVDDGCRRVGEWQNAMELQMGVCPFGTCHPHAGLRAELHDVVDGQRSRSVVDCMARVIGMQVALRASSLH
jgi:hypothetical protein